MIQGIILVQKSDEAYGPLVIKLICVFNAYPTINYMYHCQVMGKHRECKLAYFLFIYFADKKKLGLFGECEPITDNEHEFWTWFIKKYLTPEKQMIENQQVAMKSKLIDLRNKVFFFFFHYKCNFCHGCVCTHTSASYFNTLILQRW